ncbi:U2 snRNP complex subunit [Pestalotiopsis sp. IQ-011]
MGSTSEKEIAKIRMMVLETDEPDESTRNERGSFAEILHHHFTIAGHNHTPPLGIETDQRFVVAERGGRVPTFDEFDGVHSILITGSVFDAHGNNQWILDLLQLLRELYTRRPDIKFSGICFGHQLLCRLFGSEVKPQAKGEWELGHSRISLTEAGRFLFQNDASEVYLHQMHQDHVVAPPSPESSGGLLPPGTRIQVWGSSEHTQVQGVFIANRIFTTQAHLAFEETMVHRQIQMRVESGSIQDLEHADRAKETAHLEHDGVKVAAAILRFFHDEDKGVDSMGGS